MKKIGLIINPLAGIGGRVGLKGSDGEDIVAKAFSLGAVAEAPVKAAKALEKLLPAKDEFQLLTYPGPMGEDVAKSLGFEPEVIGSLGELNLTTYQDTERAALDIKAAGAELILFAGGDGTARNVYNSIGDSLPVIGIPAGVKIHSAVYADTPAHAGEGALYFLAAGPKIKLRQAEVMDIDEEAFREDRVSARLYGFMSVPNLRNLMQSAKAGSLATERESMNSIGSHIILNMEEDVCYLIGPGTTMMAVAEALGFKKTLLGVDAVLNKQLIATDLNEGAILDLLDELADQGHEASQGRKVKKAKVIVTVIGGQGYVFGRGNQQLSHKVLKKIGKENIIIGASESKMIGLGGKPLLVDTGDGNFDRGLAGYVKVITSMNRQMAYKISC